MKSQYAKIVVFVPQSHADLIRKTLAETGCGHIGNYDFCSFSVKGVGRFRPLDGTKPFIGEQGKIEEVIEERIETICLADRVAGVLETLRKVHPYEEPAIDVYLLGNL